jgi:hypothetical protein
VAALLSRHPRAPTIRRSTRRLPALLSWRGRDILVWVDTARLGLLLRKRTCVRVGDSARCIFHVGPTFLASFPLRASLQRNSLRNSCCNPRPCAGRSRRQNPPTVRRPRSRRRTRSRRSFFLSLIVGAAPSTRRSPCHTSNLATAEFPSTMPRAIDSASASVSAESRWTATILPLEANERSVYIDMRVDHSTRLLGRGTVRVALHQRASSCPAPGRAIPSADVGQGKASPGHATAAVLRPAQATISGSVFLACVGRAWWSVLLQAARSALTRTTAGERGERVN